jgi:hypothetical protein
MPLEKQTGLEATISSNGVKPFGQKAFGPQKMETHNLKKVNNCCNANIYSHLETSGGQNSTLYLKIVHFFNTSFN